MLFSLESQISHENISIPVIRIAVSKAVRLVPSSRIDALERLELPNDMALLKRLENFSKVKLSKNSVNNEIVDAAFRLYSPYHLSRFSGKLSGAWYAALQVETAIAEVIHHKLYFLKQAKAFPAIIELSELWASFAGLYVDLRDIKPAPLCLQDDDRSYEAGNILAKTIINEGYNGIIYPSQRDEGGICIVALQAFAVQSVARGQNIRIEFKKEDEIIVTPCG